MTNCWYMSQGACDTDDERLLALLIANAVGELGLHHHYGVLKEHASRLGDVCGMTLLDMAMEENLRHLEEMAEMILSLGGVKYSSQMECFLASAREEAPSQSGDCMDVVEVLMYLDETQRAVAARFVLICDMARNQDDSIHALCLVIMGANARHSAWTADIGRRNGIGAWILDKQKAGA